MAGRPRRRARRNASARWSHPQNYFVDYGFGRVAVVEAHETGEAAAAARQMHPGLRWRKMGRVPPGGAIIYAAHDEEADPSEWEAFGVAADDHYGDRFAEETSLVVIGGQTGDPRPLHPEDLAYFATLGGTTGLPQANPRASWTSETHWALPGKRKKYSVSDLLTKRDARLARRVIKEESGNPLESVRLFRKFNTATGKIWKGMTIIEMTFASGATIRVQGGEVNYRGGKIKGIGSWKGTGRTFKAALTRMGV